MKLLKACTEVPSEISNDELLMLENEFLRNELELKDIENNIEIYECILDCIEKTGKVDKSLEVMFGENVSSSENFEAEIRAQYDSACEGYMDAIKALYYSPDKHFAALEPKIKSILPKFKSVKDSAFPLTIQVPVFASPSEYRDKILPVMKKIREADPEGKIGITDQEKAEFTKVLNETKTVTVKDSHELFEIYNSAYKVCQNLGLNNHIRSVMVRWLDKKESKPARDFTAMFRLLERVVRRFYMNIHSMYEKLIKDYEKQS